MNKWLYHLGTEILVRAHKQRYFSILKINSKHYCINHFALKQLYNKKYRFKADFIIKSVNVNTNLRLNANNVLYNSKSIFVIEGFNTLIGVGHSFNIIRIKEIGGNKKQ